MSQERFIELLKQSRQVLIFTGAGISTGSGIPDFRGPQGLWKKWKPVYYQEFLSSHEARVRHWKFKLAGWKEFRDARPNAAHRALVELERKGKLSAVVTQNIDGLHQLAGQSEEKLIELHGTNRQVECLTCGRRLDPDSCYRSFEGDGQPPRCDCGGFLKPATVSFGQQMPMDLLDRAFRLASEADLVLSLGSTLEVEPAASVPRTAYEQGAPYVIVNRGPTAHDRLAHLRIDADVTRLLPDVVGAV